MPYVKGVAPASPLHQHDRVLRLLSRPSFVLRLRARTVPLTSPMPHRKPGDQIARKIRHLSGDVFAQGPTGTYAAEVGNDTTPDMSNSMVVMAISRPGSDSFTKT